MIGSKYNDEWNDNYMLRKIYNNDYVIIKDELFDIKSILFKQNEIYFEYLKLIVSL